MSIENNKRLSFVGDLKGRWTIICRNLAKNKWSSRRALEIPPNNGPSDDDSAAPSPLPSERCFPATPHNRSSHFRSSQESVLSLMSSTTTSGLGHSQSPLLISRNFRRSSNRRFSSRDLVAHLSATVHNHQQPGSGCGAAPGCGDFDPSRCGASGTSNQTCRCDASGLVNDGQKGQRSCSVNCNGLGQTPTLLGSVRPPNQRWSSSSAPVQPHCPKCDGIGSGDLPNFRMHPTDRRTVPPDLPIKPIRADLPSVSVGEPFVGRDWIFHEIYEILVHPQRPNGMRGAVVFGEPGTGKTAILYSLIKDSIEMENFTDFGISHQPAISGSRCWRAMTSQAVLAHHFCQLDDKRTCGLAELLMNIIAQTASNPAFSAYRDRLQSKKDDLNAKRFLIDPCSAFKELFTDILRELRLSGQLPCPNFNFLLLIDGLDEAEFHRPESGDSIGAFLLKNAEKLLPDFLKLVVSTRSGHLDHLKGMPLHKINLDDWAGDQRIFLDCSDYVKMRLEDKAVLRKNVAVGFSSSNYSKKSSTRNFGAESIAGGSRNGNFTDSAARFERHFARLARGNFLYMKLTLNLIEQGRLTIKGANYKVLPTNLAETFQLTLNLKFAAGRASFDRAKPILDVASAALQPMRRIDFYRATNCQFVDNFLTMPEFSERFDLVQEFVCQKRDETYTFFHSSFRDWLNRREDTQSAKYVVDIKQGHALIALSMLRKSDQLLDAEQMQVLCHHLLKAHLFKSTSSSKISANCSRDSLLNLVNLRAANIKTALITDFNIHVPNTLVTRLLLLAGADPCATDSNGVPMLCHAVKGFKNEFAALLIEFGADSCCSDGSGLTPLMCAASVGNLDAVQFLHQHKAKLSQVDNENRGALVHAALNGRNNVISFLLQCDWSETTPTHSVGLVAKSCTDLTNRGNNARQRAIREAFVAGAKNGHLQVCEFLHEFGDISIDDQCPVTKETALSVACLNSRKDIIAYLIANGAKLSYSNDDMKHLSPFMRAVECGCWEIVSSFLSKNFDLNSERNDRLETPLIKAVQMGHIGITELLINRGAALNACDIAGRTGFCWACIQDKTACASLLLERGANYDTIDSEGKRPIHYVAETGTVQLIQIIVDHCPNFHALIDACDAQGRRPLEIAIDSGNLEAVQKFLRKGAKLVPATWQSAKSNPAVFHALIQKLFDDGRILYRKNQIPEATHRFRYALKKIKAVGDADKNDQQTSESSSTRNLTYQLYLNLARCKRKSGELQSALDSCTEAIRLNPDQAEAFYCRGRCAYESKDYLAARQDLALVLRLERESTTTRNINPMGLRSNNQTAQDRPAFSRESATLLTKIDDLLRERETSHPQSGGPVEGEGEKPKNWEQGSADSGNMPDIDGLRV